MGLEGVAMLTEGPFEDDAAHGGGQLLLELRELIGLGLGWGKGLGLGLRLRLGRERGVRLELL